MNLKPKEVQLSSLVRLGRFRYVTSFIICRSDEEAGRWLLLEKIISDIAQQRSDGKALWGVTTLSADGLLVRGLSESPLEIVGDLLCFWSAAKLFLLGRAATPPRKSL